MNTVKSWPPVHKCTNKTAEMLLKPSWMVFNPKPTVTHVHTNQYWNPQCNGLHCAAAHHSIDPTFPMLICDVPQIEPYPFSLYCTTCRTVPLSCRPCYNSVIFFTLIFLSPSVEVRSLLYPYKHPRTAILTFLHKVRPSSAAAADIAHVIISDVLYVALV